MKASVIATTVCSSEAICTLGYPGTQTTSKGLHRIDGLAASEAWGLLLAVAESSFSAADETLLIVPATHPDRIEQAISLRRLVFIDELKWRRDSERDVHDATANHIVAILRGNEVVGTVRCYYREPGDTEMCIGRLAVHPDVRGLGIGGELMDAAHRELAASGHAACYLFAVESRIFYYQKRGYVGEGDLVPDVGQMHWRMRRSL